MMADAFLEAVRSQMSFAWKIVFDPCDFQVKLVVSIYLTKTFPRNLVEQNGPIAKKHDQLTHTVNQLSLSLFIVYYY